MRFWKYESAKGILEEASVLSNFAYPAVTYQLRAHCTRFNSNFNSLCPPLTGTKQNFVLAILRLIFIQMILKDFSSYISENSQFLNYKNKPLNSL